MEFHQLLRLEQDLILKMLKVNASERYTANDIARRPWITGRKEDNIPLTMHEIMT